MARITKIIFKQIISALIKNKDYNKVITKFDIDSKKLKKYAFNAKLNGRITESEYNLIVENSRNFLLEKRNTIRQNKLKKYLKVFQTYPDKSYKRIAKIMGVSQSTVERYAAILIAQKKMSSRDTHTGAIHKVSSYTDKGYGNYQIKKILNTSESTIFKAKGKYDLSRNHKSLSEKINIINKYHVLVVGWYDKELDRDSYIEYPPEKKLLDNRIAILHINIDTITKAKVKEMILEVSERFEFDKDLLKGAFPLIKGWKYGTNDT